MMKILNAHIARVSVLAALMIALTACSQDASLRVMLESPESVCPSKSVSWQGIVLGQSTKTDVVDILGKPSERNGDIFVYSPVKSVPGASYGNWVAFRSDQVVDWIEVWVVDTDGELHTVAEATQEYGTELDRVYVNKVDYGYDIVAGPDQVYVWANCGVAITAIYKLPGDIIGLSSVTEVGTDQLVFRHPVHPRDSIQPKPDVHEIILRKFLFEPTSFASFDEFYADQVSYLYDRRFYEMRFKEKE